MKSIENVEIELDEALELSAKIAHKKSPKASTILDWFVNKSIRGYLDLCYAYLRWFDDVVDDQTTDIKKRKEFFVKQRTLLEKLISSKEVKLDFTEEYFLAYFIKFAVDANYQILLVEMENMFDTIGWDLQRFEKDGIFSEKEFDKYVSVLSKSFCSIIYIFLLNHNTFQKYYKSYVNLGALAEVMMIRDLEKDINARIINISREKIQLYNLDISNLLNDKNFYNWLKDRIEYLLEKLIIEAIAMKRIPVKVRIFNFYTIVYMLPKLFRHKVYGYDTQKIKERNTLKEIKTFWLSLIFSIKLMQKLFF
jgi:phytoene/squalene synthetase